MLRIARYSFRFAQVPPNNKLLGVRLHTKLRFVSVCLTQLSYGCFIALITFPCLEGRV